MFWLVRILPVAARVVGGAGSTAARGGAVAIRSGMQGSRILSAGSRIATSVKALQGKQLLIGIPSSKKVRKGRMNNATLGYIHEFGSPAANIPARPWLVPGVRAADKEIKTRLAALAKQTLNNKNTSVDKHLTALGLVVVNIIRLRMQQGIPPPLKKSTIAARARRSAGSSYRRKASAAAHTTPLIDTGKLLASISFVIRKGKGK